MLHPNFVPWVINTIFFSGLGVALVIIGFKVFDWQLPEVHFGEELKKDNKAVGMVVSAIILGISLIIAAVLNGG